MQDLISMWFKETIMMLNIDSRCRWTIFGIRFSWLWEKKVQSFSYSSLRVWRMWRQWVVRDHKCYMFGSTRYGLVISNSDSDRETSDIAFKGVSFTRSYVAKTTSWVDAGGKLCVDCVGSEELGSKKTLEVSNSMEEGSCIEIAHRNWDGVVMP